MKKLFLSLRQASVLAQKKISKKKWNWMNCGSERENTLNENINSFKEYKINQEILNDVSSLKINKKFLGVNLRFPMIISPLGYMTQYNKKGEIGLALGAYNRSTFICLSGVSAIKIDEIMKENKNLNIIYQFYSLKPKKWAIEEIKKISKLGVKAICITADAPVRSIKYDIMEDRYDARKKGRIGLPKAPLQHMSKLNWKDIRWLRKQTKLPIIIKGVMNVSDSLKSFKNGADILWVSNHGGRVLESGVSSLEALCNIKKKIKNKQIIFDGGIRTGTDVFKAICLGADIVSIGRPAIWGLILDGANGVSRILDFFYDEFKSTLALSGCKDVSKLSKKNLL